MGRTARFAAGMLTLAPAAPAAPAPPISVNVHPATGAVSSYLDLSAHAGRRTVAGTLELENRLGRRVTVLLDGVDGLTASTLGSAYRLRGSTVHGPTRWIRLSDRRITLQPHGRETVEVSSARGSDVRGALDGLADGWVTTVS